MEIIQAEKMIENGSFTPRWLIVGESGSGKTTSLTTWPESQTGLVLDMWGNKESLEGASNLEIWSWSHMDPADPSTYVDLNQTKGKILNQLREGVFPHSVIMLDGMTGLGDVMLGYVLSLKKAGGESMQRGVGGAPQRAHYRGLSHIMGEFIKSFVAFPIPLVVICHVESYQPMDKSGNPLGPEYWRALLWGKRTRNTIYTYFSDVYRSFSYPSDKETDKFKEPRQEYAWQTKPDMEWPMLKSVLNQRGEFWGRYVNPDFYGLLERRGIA
jgi:hypothetical protein